MESRNIMPNNEIVKEKLQKAALAATKGKKGKKEAAAQKVVYEEADDDYVEQYV